MKSVQFEVDFSVIQAVAKRGRRSFPIKGNADTCATRGGVTKM
jgi:hypothetical protein